VVPLLLILSGINASRAGIFFSQKLSLTIVNKPVLFLASHARSSVACDVDSQYSTMTQDAEHEQVLYSILKMHEIMLCRCPYGHAKGIIILVQVCKYEMPYLHVAMGHS